MPEEKPGSFTTTDISIMNKFAGMLGRAKNQDQVDVAFAMVISLCITNNAKWDLIAALNSSYTGYKK